MDTDRSKGRKITAICLHTREAEIMVVFYDCTRESTEMQDREDGNGRLVVYFGFWFLFRLPFHSQDLLYRGIRRDGPSRAVEQLTRCT